ncbi:TPA: hypothetical protein ACH3X1_004082 [Trebouxia sp. C0004]
MSVDEANAFGGFLIAPNHIHQTYLIDLLVGLLTPSARLRWFVLRLENVQALPAGECSSTMLQPVSLVRGLRGCFDLRAYPACLYLDLLPWGTSILRLLDHQVRHFSCKVLMSVSYRASVPETKLNKQTQMTLRRLEVHSPEDLGGFCPQQGKPAAIQQHF